MRLCRILDFFGIQCLVCHIVSGGLGGGGASSTPSEAQPSSSLLVNAECELEVNALGMALHQAAFSLLQLVAADALVEADGGHTTQFLAV